MRIEDWLLEKVIVKFLLVFDEKSIISLLSLEEIMNDNYTELAS